MHDMFEAALWAEHRCDWAAFVSRATSAAMRFARRAWAAGRQPLIGWAAASEHLARTRLMPARA